MADHDVVYNRFDPLCLILGWLLPGLGYLRIGQPRRGHRVMSGVIAMVVIGVLVGGVDVVDRHENGLWYVPQVLVGPLVFLIDYLNVTFVKTGTIGTESIGRVNELGILFVSLAGLMNLAATIDASTRAVERSGGERRRRRHPRRRRSDHTQRASDSEGRRPGVQREGGAVPSEGGEGESRKMQRLGAGTA